MAGMQDAAHADHPLGNHCLPDGVRSRFIDIHGDGGSGSGLRMHVLEAGHTPPGRPIVLLLHGFPELAYSWRHVLPVLAAAGWHVLAPDQRGYGRTTPQPLAYDIDLAPYRMTALAQDIHALVQALGVPSVAAVVGHDFGSPVAAWCALLWPQVFRKLVMMSAPFAGAPAAPPADPQPGLAALPRPRQHYQWHYSGPQANDQMWRCRQGVHAFLRAYYHHKSADWPGNRPYRLRDGSAAAVAEMPTYYIMDRGVDMAATVAPHMPSAETIAKCRWLTEPELAVYSSEYLRTGFQGGLNWYRAATSAEHAAALMAHAGQRIEVPAMFIAGAVDWGIYQKPGAFEAMTAAACRHWFGSHLLPGAGHWVQQEQPAAVAALLAHFVQAA
jgi:pimeloyl-ACP methyl ester carboxylesterase